MDAYIAGDWVVKPGREDEFVTRWLLFTGWAQANVPGAKSFVLLRDEGDPSHFVSVGTWSDRASSEAWRDAPEFSKHLSACRELCERFYGADYTVAASPVLTATA